MLIKEWGNATWYLFHTLAYKLKDSESDHSKDLLTVFIDMCKVLPCPLCRDDAKKMLTSAKTRLVTTKYDLIRFMWQFHNLVNNKLGKQEITLDEHNAKFATAKTNSVVKYYIHVLSKNANNSTAMLETFKRKDNTASFANYMKKNNYRFNP